MARSTARSARFQKLLENKKKIRLQQESSPDEKK
jgi:hypothetical protein